MSEPTQKLENTFTFKRTEWKCTRHGPIGTDVVQVCLTSFARAYCMRCFLEALDRVGVSPAERIE